MNSAIEVEMRTDYAEVQGSSEWFESHEELQDVIRVAHEGWVDAVRLWVCKELVCVCEI